MKYQLLGKSDLQVSKIGFGCMSLKPGQHDAADIINKAVDEGINFFDTADLYDNGLNETLVGNALNDKRKDVIIATKVGNKWRKDGSGFDWDPSKKYILKAVEDSLQRLQTDYIDLYQLHGGTIDDDIDDTITAFELLKQQGKIRHYGISSIRPNVISEYVKRSNMVSVMMQYSLLDRRPEETCFKLLQQHTIGVLARGSVAGGLLAGKASKPYLNHTENIVAAAANKVATIQGGMAETAIRFALQQAAVNNAVVGIRTLQQLNEAINAVQLQALTMDELEKLKAVAPVNLYELHR